MSLLLVHKIVDFLDFYPCRPKKSNSQYEVVREVLVYVPFTEQPIRTEKQIISRQCTVHKWNKIMAIYVQVN